MQILVIKPSALGDVVHGMVAITELKKQFPECVIVWVASDKFAEIVNLSKIVRNVFIYERHRDMFSFFVSPYCENTQRKL
jgi:ADP-heptose:LPS heptosyltransferase